jgi:hypothetical protein
MLNYFAQKPKSESKRVSLKRRAIALVVALVATAAVYGLFLYSTHDVLIAEQKPSTGITMWQKRLMLEYMTVNIEEEAPDKPQSADERFYIDRITYADSDTAIVQYNDGVTYYEAEATVAFPVDEATQEESVKVIDFTVVRDGDTPLE